MFQKLPAYSGVVPLADLVDDLLTLSELAERENDPDRRGSLEVVRDHVADRDRGAKVSEVAGVLGISQPTVRAWIDAGVLEPVAGASPVRVHVLSVACIKRALDLIRPHATERQLLIHVMRLLRDREALAGEGFEEGLADLAAGRVVPLTDDLLDEIKTASRGKTRSKRSQRTSAEGSTGRVEIEPTDLTA